jgi:membrane associated rhomboid family serine protease
MTGRARVCSQCRRLNSPDDKVCYHCNARLPGGAELRLRGLLTTVLGHEQPAARFYLVLCVGIFLACAAKSGGLRVSNLEAIRWGALLPELGEPWRYLSAMFVHSGLLHILFNMMVLNDLGRILEPRLGSARFLCGFLLTGVLGFVVSTAWYGFLGKSGFTVGASGGLFGLNGVLVGYLYIRRDPTWKQELKRALVWVVLMAVVTAVGNVPINNAAHFAGLVAGVVMGLLFALERRPGRNRVVYNVLGTLLVVASLASIVASQVSVAQYLRDVARSGAAG